MPNPITLTIGGPLAEGDAQKLAALFGDTALDFFDGDTSDEATLALREALEDEAEAGNPCCLVVKDLEEEWLEKTLENTLRVIRAAQTALPNLTFRLETASDLDPDYGEYASMQLTIAAPGKRFRNATFNATSNPPSVTLDVEASVDISNHEHIMDLVAQIEEARDLLAFQVPPLSPPVPATT